MATHVLIARPGPDAGDWRSRNLRSDIDSDIDSDEAWTQSDLLYEAVAETQADGPKARLAKRRAVDARNAGHLFQKFLPHVRGWHRFMGRVVFPMFVVEPGDVLYIQHGGTGITKAMLRETSSQKFGFHVDWDLWCKKQGYREASGSTDTQILERHLAWLRDVQKAAAAGDVWQLHRVYDQDRPWGDHQRKFMEAAKFLAVTSKMREFVSSVPQDCPHMHSITSFGKQFQTFLQLGKGTMNWIEEIVHDIRVWVHLEWTDRETNGILLNVRHQRAKREGTTLRAEMKETYCDFGSDDHMWALTALKALKLLSLPGDCISRCLPRERLYQSMRVNLPGGPECGYSRV